MTINESAFSLLELLVVTAILSILLLIGISHFADYRARSFDAKALADLKNGAQAQEAYYVDNDSFADCANAAACAAVLPGITGFSNGVNISFKVDADGESFTGTARHPSGVSGGVQYQWDSAAGGLQ